MLRIEVVGLEEEWKFQVVKKVLAGTGRNTRDRLDEGIL